MQPHEVYRSEPLDQEVVLLEEIDQPTVTGIGEVDAILETLPVGAQCW